MSLIRTLGGLALCTVVLAACEPGTSSGPLASQPTGTVESTLRQSQLQQMQADPGRAMQNPVAVSASPGVGGIERAGVGAGGAGAGAPTAVNPGVGGIERAGVGAPPTPVRRSRTQPAAQ